MCNVCDASSVVESTRQEKDEAFLFGDRMIFAQAIANDGVEFQPAMFRLRRTREEAWTPWHPTLDLAGTMARIGTDVKLKPEVSIRWSHHDRTDEEDEAFLREVAVTELEPREASEDELALRVRMAAQKRSGSERRKRRIEAINRMVPRCVEYLGGGWKVRKNGYRYQLKRDGVRMQLNFDLWASVPRTPGKVKATLEKGSVKLTGSLDSLGWALVLLP